MFGMGTCKADVGKEEDERAPCFALLKLRQTISQNLMSSEVNK